MSSALSIVGEFAGLPHSTEAELEVLGAVLVDPASITAVIESGITAEDFYVERNAILWRAMLACYEADGVCDPVQLPQRLRDSGEWERSGAAPNLSRLMDRGGYVGHVPMYAATVMEKARLRRLIEAARSVEAECMAVGAMFDDARAHADAVMLSAMRQDVAGHVVGSVEAMERTFNPERVLGKTATGIRALDMKVGGLPAGRITIVGGRPGMGKSSFAVGMVAFHLRADVPPPMLFVSAEMEVEEIHGLLLAELSGHTYDEVLAMIRSGMHSDALVKARQRIENADLTTDEASAPTVADIVRRARAMADRPRGLEILVIDHWQNLTHKRERGEDSTVPAQERGIAALREFAKDARCTVVLLSQLNKAAENKQPTMADVRWCDKLVQDAGAVIFPHRPEYRDGEIGRGDEAAVIVVDKYRGAATGAVKVTWQGSRRRYV